MAEHPIDAHTSNSSSNNSSHATTQQQQQAQQQQQQQRLQTPIGAVCQPAATAASSSSRPLTPDVMGPPLPPRHASHSPRLPSMHEQGHAHTHAHGQGGRTHTTPLFGFGPPTQSGEWSGGGGAGGGVGPPVVVRHSLPPSYPSSLLHAPRPQLHPLSALSLHYPESGASHDSRSRMRGDGFLLDDEDQPDGLDLSNSEAAEPLPLQLQRGASTVDEATTTTEEREPTESHFLSIGPPLLHHSAQVRPRSADVSLAPPAGSPTSISATKLVRGATHDGTHPALQLVCPSCGDHPAGADTETAFHAHVSRCFVMQHIGRPPRTPQASPMTASDNVGPIRKTRVRASSAAASTGSAAELASALAAAGAGAGVGSHGHSNYEPHGYHPYGGGGGAPHLGSTLRHLRRTVDQLDLHQRISIMEAFNKLSRVALVEQQQAAVAATTQSMMMGAPSPRAKRLRSCTNSPSPKHKPIEENVKDILSLLYSPRITAPHPSPNPLPGANGVHRGGVPSPLVIGIASHANFVPSASLAHEQRSTAEAEAAAAANSHLLPPPQPSIMSSPVSQMDTLELEPGYHAHANAQTPLKSAFSYAQQQQQQQQATPTTPQAQVQGSLSFTRVRGSDSVSVESSVSSPVAMSTDVDGSESDAAACSSALSLTGAFVHAAISSGASSPASATPSAASEQTSPGGNNTDANGMALDRTASGSVHPSRVFPAHCFPDSQAARHQSQPPASGSSDSPVDSFGGAVHPDRGQLGSPSHVDGSCSRSGAYADEVTEKQRMNMRHNHTATARG